MAKRIMWPLRKHRERVLFKSPSAIRNRCGFSQQFLSMIERGERRPRAEDVPNLAKAYEISPEQMWQYLDETAELVESLRAEKAVQERP